MTWSRYPTVLSGAYLATQPTWGVCSLPTSAAVKVAATTFRSRVSKGAVAPKDQGTRRSVPTAGMDRALQGGCHVSGSPGGRPRPVAADSRTASGLSSSLAHSDSGFGAKVMWPPV